MAVRLRIMDRADKDVLKLSRTDKGAVWEFVAKFRNNPANPGLQFKQLKGDSRLHSARVSQDYRALLLHVGDGDYLLVAVRHRKDVYDNIEDKYAYQINRVTGGIEIIDLTPVGDSIIGRIEGEGAPDGVPVDPSPAPPAVAEPAPLFGAITDADLLRLGVAEPLLPVVRQLRTEDDLLGLVDNAPELTVDVLFQLAIGKSVDEVYEEVTAPVAVEETVDPEDYAAAVARPATQVTTDDEALQAMLDEPFARWQIYLHPTQRKLVDRTYTGPTRVGGGPGTGKTIVALHRVAHLVEHLDPGADRPILLTTFNRNLAADLRARLLLLGGEKVLARVDITTVDSLAQRIVKDAGLAGKRRVIDDSRAVAEWDAMLLELGDQRFDAEFLHTEWSQVILGQALTSRADYFRVRRPGRGRSLDRSERDQIWKLTEQYTKRLEDLGLWTWRQIAAIAASVSVPRFRHVVVDEAQDLSPAHWKMLRALVPEGADDMFLAGDTHQRIYDSYVTLGSLGINIRGRSSRLTRCYRTTREILAAGMSMLTGESYDDLDGGEETLAGYRSLLYGQRPAFCGLPNWHAERDAIAAQLAAWGSPADGTVAIALPTREHVTEMIERLGDVGVEIGPDGPARPDGVHVGTMHRFKGLEYQRVIVGAVSDGLVPHASIAGLASTDPRRYQRERARYRSLLFVAATRARDGLAVFWHGNPSPFLSGVTSSDGT